MKRVLAIAAKEVIHILRDPRSLAVAVLMPVAMVLLYGAVIDMELHDLRVAVMDLDHSDQSRAFVRAMTASGFIVDAEHLTSRAGIEPGFRQGRFLAALVIPERYAERIARGEPVQVQVLVDGSDAATAAIASNYLQAVVMREAQRLRADAPAAALPVPFAARTRVWFNPELVSADFVVPGLVALVLMMICAILTSITITREKETGTLEQILTTPIRPAQVIAGKVLPYTVLAACDAALILLIGRLVFAVPMQGSLLALAAYCLLFIVIALSVGLLISAVASTLRVAMMAAIMATMLPTMILSGFMFPIASMPAALQVICRILPPTHFLVILRGIMLKGQNWYPLQTAILAAQAVILLTLAVRKFRLRLE
jgi:ABC-2 type transport system permease protein